MNAQVIKTECDNNNTKAWMLLVVKIIIEMLVNAIAPSAVAKNLKSTIKLICPSVVIEELPNSTMQGMLDE